MSNNSLLSYLIDRFGEAAARRTLTSSSKTNYVGVLNSHMSIPIGHLFGDRPAWYPGNDDMWQHLGHRLRKRETEEWRQRELALAELFSVPYCKPDLHNCWYRIAINLAVTHVRGFKYATDSANRPGRGGNPKLTKEQTGVMARLVAESLEKGKHEDREIAAYLRAQNVLKVSKVGTKRDCAVPISRSTSESYVKQLRTAWRTVCDGSATAFQYQAVEVALAQREVTHWGAIFSFKGDAKRTKRSTNTR